jgi:hypothetical protein
MGEGLLFLSERVGVPFLDRKKDKLEDKSVKRPIFTTFGATEAPKRG